MNKQLELVELLELVKLVVVELINVHTQRSPSCNINQNFGRVFFAKLLQKQNLKIENLKKNMM